MSEEDSPRQHPGNDSHGRQSPLVPAGGRIDAASRRSLVRRGLDQLGLMPKRRIRLLLVDDFAEWRRELRKVLEARFEIVGEAETGEEGIALYRRHNPDIVLTDVHMPTMDGITMAQNIAAESPVARILFLSTASETPIFRMALECGAYGYLLQPINLDTLTRLIDEIALQSGHGKRFYFDEHMSLYELEGDFVDDEAIRPKRGWSQHPVGALIVLATPRPTGSRLVKDLTFTEITRLDLSSSAITDAAGPVVGRALNLESLSAAHTRVGDEFMFSLSACRQLEWLDISSTSVGITGLSVLPTMVNLTTLVMNHMERNMGDLHYISRIPGLRSLYIRTARIEKGALRNLAQLHHLEHLDLEGTPFEEGDVHAIASIHTLKWVNLRNTGLDADSFELLKRRLPACKLWL